jgi:hypothetical protein
MRAPGRSDRGKKGCTASPLGTITARARKTDHKEEDDVARGPNKGMPKRGSAFEKLQSEREAKGVEEDLARDVEERQQREQIRQEEREERKREREKARGQEESS